MKFTQLMIVQLAAQYATQIVSKFVSELNKHRITYAEFQKTVDAQIEDLRDVHNVQEICREITGIIIPLKFNSVFSKTARESIRVQANAFRTELDPVWPLNIFQVTEDHGDEVGSNMVRTQVRFPFNLDKKCIANALTYKTTSAKGEEIEHVFQYDPLEEDMVCFGTCNGKPIGNSTNLYQDISAVFVYVIYYISIHADRGVVQSVNTICEQNLYTLKLMELFLENGETYKQIVLDVFGLELDHAHLLEILSNLPDLVDSVGTDLLSGYTFEAPNIFAVRMLCKIIGNGISSAVSLPITNNSSQF